MIADQSPLRIARIALTTAVLATVMVGVSRADEGREAAPLAAPRVAVETDGRSVVLVAANDRLYAFVDRTADNAPDDAVTLRIKLQDSATELGLTHDAPGLFSAPWRIGGRISDRFDIALADAPKDGTQPQAAAVATADLAYGLTTPTAPQEDGSTRTSIPFHLGFALWALSAGLAGLLGWLGHRAWIRGWRAAGGHAA